MAKVKVTAIATHYGPQRLIKAGDTYEIDETFAPQLKQSGLIEWEGDAAPAPPKEGEKVLHVSDKPAAEKAEVKPGQLPKTKTK